MTDLQRQRAFKEKATIEDLKRAAAAYGAYAAAYADAAYYAADAARYAADYAAADAAARADEKEEQTCIICRAAEIIGNIHETPELSEGTGGLPR